MTTVANLLARKQQLLDRLHEDPGSHERHEIERVLAQIDTALNFLDEPVGASGDEQRGRIVWCNVNRSSSVHSPSDPVIIT